MKGDIMRYRELGTTGLSVSEIGFGPEWMKGTPEETRAVAETCREGGVNLLDCWMSDPLIRDNLGYAMKGHTDEWIVQGHFGACWIDGQYQRSRDLAQAVPAFEDELRRLGVDHFDLGMLHYIDNLDEFNACMQGEFYEYLCGRKEAGVVGHIGLSTHNPHVARAAVETGQVEAIMFSINPAFDMMPPSDDINTLFGDFGEAGEGIDPERDSLYKLCEARGVGLTVMKPYAGGRLLSAETGAYSGAVHPLLPDAPCGGKRARRLQDGRGSAGGAGLRGRQPRRARLRKRARRRAGALVLWPVHVLRTLPTVRGRHRHRHGEQIRRPREDARRGARVGSRPLRRPTDCIGCASCEPNCPFGVPIASRMAETVNLFA